MKISISVVKVLQDIYWKRKLKCLMKFLNKYTEIIYKPNLKIFNITQKFTALYPKMSLSVFSKLVLKKD